MNPTTSRRPPGGQNRRVGLTNEELASRYRAGENLDQLAADADTTVNSVQARLRRIGVPRDVNPPKPAASPKTPSPPPSISTDRSTPPPNTSASPALPSWPKPNATDCAAPSTLPPTSSTDTTPVPPKPTAAHYGVAASTVGLWLQSHGITRRRGRRPIDG